MQIYVKLSCLTGIVCGLLDDTVTASILPAQGTILSSSRSMLALSDRILLQSSAIRRNNTLMRILSPGIVCETPVDTVAKR